MNINTFKFKNQQSTNPFFSNSSPSKHDDKYPSIKPNSTKKVYQSIFKLQNSSRQHANLARKNRYDPSEERNVRINNIKSVSLERKTIINDQKQGKFAVFKSANEINKKDPKSSLEKKSQSLYSNKNKRTLFSKKLTILNNGTNQSHSKDSKKSINAIESQDLRTLTSLHQKTSVNYQKMRVNSTLCKLESLQLNNSDVYQSSSKTLTGRRKTNEIQKKLPNINEKVQMVKILIKSEQYSKALTILRQTLNQKSSKLNPELIELFISCLYNAQRYQQVTKMYQNIRGIQQRWSSQFYMMVCLSYAKQKLSKHSLLVIEKAAQIYSENPEVFYYKGKMLYHMKKYDLAEKAFQESIEIHQLPQTLMCLADCYRKTNQKQKELQTINTILNNTKSISDLKLQDFLMKKLRLLFQLERYCELLEDFQTLHNQNKTLKILSPIDPQMQFLSAFSNYKLDHLESAHEKFQDLVTSQNFQSQSLKMLIIIEIKQRNFYEASRLCNQVSKKQQRIKNNEIFKLLSSFVQGSINLVRRNFKDGIERLSQVELSIQGFEKNKLNGQKIDVRSVEQVSNIEGYDTVRNLINLFLSYGLFCIGQYQFCQSAIQKQRLIDNNPKYSKTITYTFTLCSAILSYQSKKYQQVMCLLNEAEGIYPQRMELYFYRAVVMIKGLLRLGGTEEEKKKRMEQIWDNINGCLSTVSSYGSNTRATILYYKTLLHSYTGDWSSAMTSITECISLSDQNYWRYYYCKGMILACIHNFEQAITQLNTAISLSDGFKSECFLLRSKCLQIEGRGSEAFADLQQYIALKPHDEEIHKYAGQILFQNGAFEDALVAFQHHQIPQTYQNHDIYLTLAKTLFLTGKFNSAQQKMTVASKLKPQQHQIQFDSRAIGFLDKLVRQILSKTINDHKLQLIDQVKDIFFKDEGKKGKIFHYCDGFLFQALINLYAGDYAKAIENFQRHLSKRKKMIIFDDTLLDINKNTLLDKNTEQQFIKTTKQLKIYTNQMKFNITLCYLANDEIQKAQSQLKQIKIDKSENFYQSFSQFKSAILNQTFILDKQEILPNKNKLSQFLPPLEINIKQKSHMKRVKICVPFPKVEPPQIFPIFDQSLLKTLTIFGIDVKPQAPWIVKEDNVIKFTEKISYASRLDFNDSDVQSSNTTLIDFSNTQFKQKKQLNTDDLQNASLLSKRLLKHNNSIKIQN